MGRLRDAIARINPKVPAEAQDEALRRVIRTETANFLENNRRFHRMLVDGIDVEYQADGQKIASKRKPELDVLIHGVFEMSRFMDLIQHFIVIEVDAGTIIRKMAGYHQFHAVYKAVDCTLKAISARGDRRVGGSQKLIRSVSGHRQAAAGRSLDPQRID